MPAILIFFSKGSGFVIALTWPENNQTGVGIASKPAKAKGKTVPTTSAKDFSLHPVFFSYWYIQKFSAYLHYKIFLHIILKNEQHCQTTTYYLM